MERFVVYYWQDRQWNKVADFKMRKDAQAVAERTRVRRGVAVKIADTWP